MNKISITQPILPSLDEFTKLLTDIWDRKWVTNNGEFHKEFETALSEYLGVPYISLFSNGTLALISALQALNITGEVITTPYSFVATTHAIWWNHIKPVFVDIEPEFCTIDPKKIESAITPATTAILPVHIYGNPCREMEIQAIADRYGLKVIYDAAHAFSVRQKGESILNFGDLSVLSFHATKVFNTIEGGAIVCHNEKIKKQIDYLKNFGITGETEVVAPGINAKMNEVQAAYGILQLKSIDEHIKERKKLSEIYRKYLDGVRGIRLMKQPEDLNYNYAYVPIFVDEQEYGISRDALYKKLEDNNIYGRRYFYPLISQFPTYQGLDSAKPSNLPVAMRLSQEVICLPIYPELHASDVRMICSLIKKLA
ncbi:DegT/DnrJ/EryC1/StrS family aminotransferase [uncultured Draconibacterium sp.]|uniref:DegT/DnrJ/EryC1/StrS family aminotransferase n=1 Tax=uncultured Draconibacterium sp. TaxID=1573823 RepID=UPI002AA91DDA|nr:DegT/DnrJ/EryC1/StrS family aminotransferase [uncultured Draconibacterium sp.]